MAEQESLMNIEKRTVEFSPHSRNIFFHILTQCNLKCSHCYINPEQHGTTVLDKETIFEWLRILVESEIDLRQLLGPHVAPQVNIPKIPQETNVIFLGGEPTLNPHLPDAISEAQRLGCRSITVDSNGYLFHDFLEKVSPDQLDFLSFSLDGSKPAVNDPIRGEGVFDVCTRNIRKAVAKGFATSLIFTVSSKNIDDLPNMVPLLRELGIERFFIQVIGIRGRSAGDWASNLQVDRENWNRIVPEVAQEVASSGIPVTYPKVYLDENEEFACAGLVADNYFVFPNGRIYRCPLCEDYPIHSLEIGHKGLMPRPPVRESDLFVLDIPEGCVLNKILHPGNIRYDEHGRPESRIACCMLKEELL